LLSHPALNAALNGTSAVFLSCGYAMIRRKKILAHRACMILAFCSSTVFLISYVIYHARVGSVHFQGQGWIRPVYFTLLGTHTLLAAAIVPLALITLTRALREQFDRHRRIARWTLPIWLYVSVTGVIIYVMLYHLYVAPRA
jgi:putative membrane protein